MGVPSARRENGLVVDLHQGSPAKKGVTVAMAAWANPILVVRDPTLFCTGFQRQRFYMLTRSEPE